jgi:hypothetical protein
VEKFNQFLDKVSDFLAHRKGLLPILGILLVVLNWILQFVPGLEGFAGTNTLLHLGVVISVIGFMLAWAL